MKTIMAIWEWVKADVAKGKPSTWVNPSNITPPLTEEEKAILQQYKLERDFVLSANGKMPLRRLQGMTGPLGKSYSDKASLRS